MRPVLVQLSQNHMATTFQLQISCEPARAVVAERVLLTAQAMIAKLEAELSEFREDSPVCQLNASRPYEKISAPESLLELLSRAQALHLKTQGAFDPTFRSGYSTKNLADKLEWNREEGWVRKKDARVKLGFGAIGKGFAIDEVRALLEREGFTDYLLNAGGSSILVSGHQARGQPWRIGWSWKKDSEGAYLGQELAHRTGQSIAIGISGSLEQGEHIRGGGSLLSAWVSGSSATTCDALSTALYSLGWEEGYERIVDPLARLSIAAISREEVPYWNGHFQKNFGAPRSGREESNTSSVELPIFPN